MCMLIKLTQINKFTYDCLSLLLLNSTVYQYFHFYKTRVIFCMFFSFLKRKVVITCNAEENTCSQRDLGWNLKKKGIKLKLSGKVHFYLRNNILKFHQNPKGGRSLFWPLNHDIWSQNVKNLTLENSKLYILFDRSFDLEQKILL